MPTALGWLQRFFSGGRVRIEGQSLHRYRCSDEEFRSLEDVLRWTSLETGAECACFALYAAEWLRRCFEGGSWSWQGVLTQLDSPLERLPYDRMEAALRRHWGLEVVRLNGNRQLLATLLIQGGLPLRAIEREGNALRLMVQKLLDEAIATAVSVDELTELAASWASALPQSWRHESVYRLLAEITEVTATLSARIPEGADPIEHLQQHPGWADRLPLSVTEEVGRALFSFMVEQAHGSAAMRRLPLRIETQLRKVGDAWHIVRRTKIPEQLTHTELTTLLGVDVDTSLPYRLELHVQNERREQQHIGTATVLRQGTDGVTRYLVDARGRSRVLAIDGSLGVIAVSGAVSYGPEPLDGGEDRSPLPWIFRPIQGHANQWELVAQGSARLRVAEAMIAITKDSVVAADDDRGEVVARGAVGERLLFGLRGHVRITTDGELCRLRLAAQSDDVTAYALVGSIVHGLGNAESVFRGVPTLRASVSGHRYAPLNHGVQQWRAPRGAWSGDPSSCVGKVELRHVVDGETMHIRRWVQVLPAGFSYVSTPDRSGRSGRLRVLGLNSSITAELVDDETFTATKTDEGDGQLAWSIVAHAEGVARFGRLRVHWRNGTSSELLVPLPVADARFVTVDGQVLPDRADVALDSAHRVRAEVVGSSRLVAEARLVIRLEDHQLDRHARAQLEMHMPLTRVEGQPGFARLDLARMIDKIRLRFAASQRPDARVELEIDLQGHRRTLRIQRYELGLRHDRDDGELCFDGDPIPSLCVESFPVDHPAATPHVHEQTSQGRWRVSQELVAQGARLAVGRIDGVAHTCTVLLAAPRSASAFDEAELPPTASIDLATAARLPTLSRRIAAFVAAIRRLEHDLDDPDWKLLLEYVHTLGDLHAATFDVIETLITRPRAVVIALSRARTRKLDKIWAGLEDLPFAWHTIPARDWITGLHSTFAWIGRRYPDDPGIAAERIERLREFAAPRLPSADFVFELARPVFAGEAEQACARLALLMSDQIIKSRWDERDRAKSQLIRDMNARAEATGNHRNWPSGPLVSRIVEQAIGTLLPDLSDLRIPTEPRFRYREPLFNAPVVAAMLVAAPDDLCPERWNELTDSRISRRELLFELRRLREQAPTWYDRCFDLTLVDASARRRREIFMLGDEP